MACYGLWRDSLFDLWRDSLFDIEIVLWLDSLIHIVVDVMGT